MKRRLKGMNMKDGLLRMRFEHRSKVTSLLYILLFATAFTAHGQTGPSGADQILSAVYDKSTKTLRVSSGSGSGSVTSVGLSMPSEFNVTGSPVTTSGTLSVLWAQPLTVADGGTGQSTAAGAFNALAPPTSPGGLIYGTSANTYGNLLLGSSGQCLQSNGATLVWGSCGTGSAAAFQVNGTGLLSSTTVNFENSAATNGLTLSFSNPSAGNVQLSLGGTLSVAGGGTGTSSPAMTAGSNISITGTWPNNTISFSGTLPVVNGGTGLTTVGTSGQCLTSNGTAMMWGSCGPASLFIASGDLSGTSSSQTVIGLEGRPLSSVAPAPGQMLEWNGTTWGPATLSGLGALTSVGLSLPSIFAVTGTPVTSSGTLTGTLVNENTNTIFAGPPTGAAGVPSFRPLAGPDIPAINVGISGNGGVTGVLSLANGGTGTGTPALTGGSNISITGTWPNNMISFAGTLPVANGGTGLTALGTSGQCLGTNGSVMLWQSCGSGSGTVSSVALSLPSIFTVSGSPVTNSGTLTGALASQSANTFFMGPASGAAAAPTFRTVTAADLAPSPVTNDCMGYNGAALAWFACSGGSGGLPSSWALNTATNAVTAQPISGQDAVPLTIAPNVTAPTADLFDIYEDPGKTAKAFWVTPNGNINWAGNNLQLGANNQPTASYIVMPGGVGAGAYDEFESAALTAPANPTVTAGTGGSLPAATYSFEWTYKNGTGNIYETPANPSGLVSASVAASGTVIVSIPAAEPGANVAELYGKQSTNGALLDCGNINLATLAWTQHGTSCSAPAIAVGNATFSSWTNSSAGAPPGAGQNNTGGVFQTYLSAGEAGSGDACVMASVPGQNCTTGSWIMTNPMTAPGDIFYGGTVNADGFAPPTRLAIGSPGQCLGVATATTLGWQPCGGGSSTVFQANGTSLISSSTVNFQGGGPISVTNPNVGNVQLGCPTCVVISSNNVTLGNGDAVTLNAGGFFFGGSAGRINGHYQTTDITIQAGIGPFNSPSQTGGIAIEGGDNAGTGGAGNVILRGGNSTGSGNAGNATVEAGTATGATLAASAFDQPFTVSTAITAGQLVCAGTADDQVQPCAAATSALPIGFAISGASSGQIEVEVAGLYQNATTDTACTRGNYVVVSSTTAGRVACASTAPVSLAAIGIVTNSPASGAIAHVLVRP